VQLYTARPIDFRPKHQHEGKQKIRADTAMRRCIVLWRLLQYELKDKRPVEERHHPLVETQIAVYALIALAAVLFIRRTLKIRSLKEYGPSDLEQLLKTSHNILLLDVRSDAERQTGSIKSSIHIPLQVLRTRFSELEKYKGREIICFCQTGSRSVSAALLLRGKGFTVANLRGGMADWNFAHR